MTIAAGMQFHWTTLFAQAGVSGQWIRLAGGSSSVELVPGSSLTETTLDTGVSVESRDQSFVGHYSQFVDANGAPPVEGDKFQYTDESGLTRTFEVINPLGEKPWSWSDTAHVMFRVQAHEVGS